MALTVGEHADIRAALDEAKEALIEALANTHGQIRGLHVPLGDQMEQLCKIANALHTIGYNIGEPTIGGES